EQLRCWNDVLGQFIQSRDPEGQGPRAFTAEMILSPRGPYRSKVRDLEPRLREHGLAWDRLPALLQLRTALCELEIRFTRVGPEGLFNVRDRGGHLRHALPEITPASIEEATRTPPARGR